MNEHALDVMIYAYQVMKEKEENKMEGIYVGKIKRSVINKDNVNLLFIDHRQDIHHLSDVIDYEDTAYCLVPANDIIINNDEILKLRDEVKRLANECKEWDDECNDWKARYSKVNNELFQKGLAYGMLEETYKKEKADGEVLLKDRDTWKRRWNSVVTDIGKSLEASGIEFALKEIHGDGNWDVVIDIPERNEAKKKIADLEKKLKVAESKESYWLDRKEEEEDYHHYWLHTYDRVKEQAAEKGVYIALTGDDEDCNAGVVVVENKKAEELEAQVKVITFANDTLDSFSSALTNDYNSLKAEKEDLYEQNQKLGFELSKQKSTTEYWRNTYYSAVEKAKEVGVSVTLGHGVDWKANVALFEVTNYRANNLEKKIKRLEDDNVAAKDRGDYWKRKYDDLAEYWDNTRKDLVTTGKKVGVKIEFKGDKPDSNIGNFDVTNEKCIELMVEVSDTKHKYNKKWQAMLNALKAKGVEVIYMGEADENPVIDVKIPGLESDKQWASDKGQQCSKLKADLNDLKKEYGRVLSEFALCRKQAEYDRKELEDLKSKKVATCTVEAGADGRLKFIYTYMDGHNEPAHINCLCKNYVDAESISCGTIPKCKTCKNHQYFTNGGHLCHRPDSKYKIPGMFHIKYLTEEEAEGPACAEFEAREEVDCKDCKHHETAFWRVSTDGEGMAVCRSPKTKYGFCRNNCNGEKACPEFEKKE